MSLTLSTYVLTIGFDDSSLNFLMNWWDDKADTWCYFELIFSLYEIGLSALIIAGISIASVMLLGVGIFVWYFFFYF